MKTRDIDIRSELHAALSSRYLNDDDAVIIDELGLCQGEARVDVALVNGVIHGYEIKSDSDSLERLPHQIYVYNRVLDIITIVTGKSHMERIKNLVPEWWGIIQVEKIKKNKVRLVNIREPKENSQIDPYSLVQLLWREEALEILITLGLEKGYLSKSRKEIWKRLASSVNIHDLQFYVRQQLKTRTNWRVVRQRK